MSVISCSREIGRDTLALSIFHLRAQRWLVEELDEAAHVLYISHICPQLRERHKDCISSSRRSATTKAVSPFRPQIAISSGPGIEYCSRFNMLVFYCQAVEQSKDHSSSKHASQNDFSWRLPLIVFRTVYEE